MPPLELMSSKVVQAWWDIVRLAGCQICGCWVKWVSWKANCKSPTSHYGVGLTDSSFIDLQHQARLVPAGWQILIYLIISCLLVEACWRTVAVCFLLFSSQILAWFILRIAFPLIHHLQDQAHGEVRTRRRCRLPYRSCHWMACGRHHGPQERRPGGVAEQCNVQSFGASRLWSLLVSYRARVVLELWHGTLGGQIAACGGGGLFHLFLRWTCKSDPIQVLSLDFTPWVTHCVFFSQGDGLFEVFNFAAWLLHLHR